MRPDFSLFKNRFFIIGASAFLVSVFMAFPLRNPNIANTTIPWHFIPEMVSVGFLGLFSADVFYFDFQLRFSSALAVFFFLFCLFSSWLFIVKVLFSFPLLSTAALTTLLTCSIVESPFLLGYAIERWRRKK